MPDHSLDSYKVITAPATSEFKDRGSKFLGFAFPVSGQEEIDRCLEEVKKEHFKARHHCYAWRLGPEGNPFRINDDGEPSGTAGKPIYGQIIKKKLSDILIVVVRYFGGTKLGTSGLILAYKSTAAEALKKTDIKLKILKDKIRIHFDYSAMGPLLNIAKEMDLDITDKLFELKPYIDIAVRQSEKSETLTRLKARLLDKSVSEVDEETEVPFCTFTEIQNP